MSQSDTKPNNAKATGTKLNQQSLNKGQYISCHCHPNDAWVTALTHQALSGAISNKLHSDCTVKHTGLGGLSCQKWPHFQKTTWICLHVLNGSRQPLGQYFHCSHAAKEVHTRTQQHQNLKWRGEELCPLTEIHQGRVSNNTSPRPCPSQSLLHSSPVTQHGQLMSAVSIRLNFETV